MIKTIALLGTAALALAACQNDGGGDTRTTIRIVGSSTVYPFTTAVAEQFGRKHASFQAPIVESTGTGGGIKLFCSGVGAQFPDVVNASRRMKKSESDSCAANGVKEVVELQVGIDGIALAESQAGQPLKLSPEDVYKALAKTPYGKPQTAKTWQDVNPALPAVRIHVFGPPPTSGTRDAFAELIMEPGCEADAATKELKKSDEDQFKAICTGIREDGAYVEAGENDNLIVQKLVANPDAVGIFGYSFLEENTQRVRGIAINGIEPTSQTIGDFSYPGARPLFIYVKAAHARVIPGLKEFVAEYANGWNEDGYLIRRGLIPSPAEVRAENLSIATNLTPLDPSKLK